MPLSPGDQGDAGDEGAQQLGPAFYQRGHGRRDQAPEPRRLVGPQRACGPLGLHVAREQAQDLPERMVGIGWEFALRKMLRARSPLGTRTDTLRCRSPRLQVLPGRLALEECWRVDGLVHVGPANAPANPYDLPARTLRHTVRGLASALEWVVTAAPRGEALGNARNRPLGVLPLTSCGHTDDASSCRCTTRYRTRRSAMSRMAPKPLP
jgi:hypothetical protein